MKKIKIEELNIELFGNECLKIFEPSYSKVFKPMNFYVEKFIGNGLEIKISDERSYRYFVLDEKQKNFLLNWLLEK